MRALRPAVGVLLAVLLVAGQPAVAGAQARDADGDGMPNKWEAEHGLKPFDPSDADDDPDHDKLLNLSEYLHRGDPRNADTDADGLKDGAEVLTWQSLVDVPNQMIGRAGVSGRCPQTSAGHECKTRYLFAVLVVVKNRRGQIVAQTRTLINGRFALQGLAHGSYEVSTEAIAGAAAPAPLQARVPRRQGYPTVASFTFDDSNGPGVVGQATQGPTCPGPQREGEDCAAPLEGATIEVREGDENGPVVASVTTGSDGYYAFELSAGSYTLVATRMDGDGSFPIPPAPQAFTVFSNDTGPNLVDAHYDTGIR